MSKRISMSDKLKKENEKEIKPLDKLFKPTEKKELKIERKTYYITEDLINALQLYKAYEDIDMSVIVREALYEYIPNEYIEKALDKIESEESDEE